MNKLQLTKDVVLWSSIVFVLLIANWQIMETFETRRKVSEMNTERIISLEARLLRIESKP